MQTGHPNPSMPPLMQLKLCPSVLCLLLFLVAASMHDIQSCCAADPCCFPCCKDTAGKKQHALSPARKTLGSGSFCFPSLWLSCQHTKIVSPLSNEPMPQIRTTRKAGDLLWPYKGLLPAAPKDAGFHVVQAQCPCRLDYPLKGS